MCPISANKLFRWICPPWTDCVSFWCSTSRYGTGAVRVDCSSGRRTVHDGQPTPIRWNNTPCALEIDWPLTTTWPQFNSTSTSGAHSMDAINSGICYYLLSYLLHPSSHPSVSSSLQITNRSFTYASPTCGISSLLHSVNLILFTLLLVHLILRISPHHSHHLHSHHLTLPLPSTPDLKLISFTNPFLRSHSHSFRTDFTDLNLYWIKGALFVCFSFRLRVLD